MQVRSGVALALAFGIAGCAGGPSEGHPSARRAPLAASVTQSVVVVQDDGVRTVPLVGAPWSSDPVASARATLLELGLPNRDDALRLVRTWTWRGRTTVALQQLHGGVPVRGGGATVHLDREGRPRTVTAHAWPGLEVDPTPGVSRAEAALLMTRALPGHPSRPLEPRLTVLPFGRGRLVWEATVTTASPPDLWRVSMPAEGGEPRVERRSHSAMGRVYPLHPHAGEPVEVALEGLGEAAFELTSPAVDVRSAAWLGETLIEERQAAPDEAGDFLFEPALSEVIDPFAEVNVYHHLERATAFFAERFGGAAPGPVRALVNYEEAPGEGYSNAYAFLDEEGQFGMVFGQTAELDFAYSALIAAHELGHPFFDAANDTPENTEYPVNIDAQGFHSAPGAMNEGMSDYWAGAITGDVDVLSYIAEDGDLQRTLRRLDGGTRCPDDLLGEAHMDGPLLSTTLWQLRGELGATAIDEVAWALIHQLEGAPTFADAAAIIRQNVVALVEDGVLPAGSAAIADQALDAHGIADCARSVPLVEGAPRVGTAIGANTVAGALGMDGSICSTLRLLGARVPLVVSYVATVPDGPVGGLSLVHSLERLDGEPLQNGDALFDVVVRKGAPAELMLVPIPLGGVTLNIVNGVAAAELIAADSPAAVEIASSELELLPGDTVHVNILSAHCQSMRHETTLAWLPPAPPAPDVVGGDAGEAADVADDAEQDTGTGDAGDGSAGKPDAAASPDAVAPDAVAVDAPDSAPDSGPVTDTEADAAPAPAPGATTDDGCRTTGGPGGLPLLLVALGALLAWVPRRQRRT